MKTLTDRQDSVYCKLGVTESVCGRGSASTAAIIAATLPPQLNYTAAICVDLPRGEGGQATVLPPHLHSNLSTGGTAWHCLPPLPLLHGQHQSVGMRQRRPFRLGHIPSLPVTPR